MTPPSLARPGYVTAVHIGPIGLAAFLIGIAGCAGGGAERVAEPAPPPALEPRSGTGADTLRDSSGSAQDWRSDLEALAERETAAHTERTGRAYVLGPDDEVDVQVFGAPDLSARSRVDSEGSVSLPLLGAVPAAGKAPPELEEEIERRLAATYMKNPHVRVEVTSMTSRTISVLGSVREPGVYPLEERTTVLSAIARAGGLAEDAAQSVYIVRERQNVEEVDLRRLLSVGGEEGAAPALQPGDVIQVPPAGLVYVVGTVNRPGGFPVTSGEPLTVLQAIALAQGLGPTAAHGRSIIIREQEDGTREEIPVPLDKVLDGSMTPPKLQARDVLFVPNNTAKSVARGMVEALVRMVTLRGLIGP